MMKSLATILFITMNLAVAADRSEINLLDKTQIPLTQAVDLALNEIPGKVFEVDLDSIRRLPVYEVSILTEDKVYEVTIDAINGTIIKVDLD